MMNEIDLFRTKSQLGSFGEFCYVKFARLQEIPIQRTGILEYDFIVANEYCVDVKTTQSRKTSYSGKRVRENVSYDLISVRDGVVKIFPDRVSPLNHYRGEKIGDLEELYSEWQNNKGLHKDVSRAQDIHRINRKNIKNDLFKIFEAYDLRKIRVIFRGTVSKTRWSSSPDNLPGSSKVVKTNDLTIFVQMHAEDQQEYIEKIFLLKHDMFPVIKMMRPDPRQMAKGIEMILDLEWFESNFPQHVFGDIESMKRKLSEQPELFSSQIKNQT